METCSDAECALRLDQLSIPSFLARLNENSRREGKNCGMVGLLRPKLVSAGQSGCIFYGVDRVLSVELRLPSRLTRIIGGVVDAVTNIPTTSELTVLRIATDGWDVEPVGAMTNRKPSEIRTDRIGEVPGLDAPVSNLFGVSQVLSWIVG